MNKSDLLENISHLEKEIRSGTPDWENFKSNLNTLPFLFRNNCNLKTSVFRALEVPQEDFDKPIYPGRFSYPPKNKVKVKIGRANIEDNPVCYVSNSVFCAIMELMLSSSTKSLDLYWRTVYVAEWKPKLFAKANAFQLSGRIPDNTIGFDSELSELTNKYLELIAECFLIESESAYNFTANLCHFLMYNRGSGRPNTDIVEYPSVVEYKKIKDFNIKSEIQSLNYAIYPHFFDKHYELVKVTGLGIPNSFKWDLKKYFEENTLKTFHLGEAKIDKSSRDGRLKINRNPPNSVTYNVQ